MKVEEVLIRLGGNTKVCIFTTDIHNQFKNLWLGIVDDIDFDNDIPYGNREVEFMTVVNGEDILQIEI